MRRQMLLALTVLLVAWTHQVAAQTESDLAEQGQVETRHREFIAAWTAGDVDRVMTFYAENAVTMAPNALAFVGKDAIRAVYEVVLGLYESEFLYQVDEVEVSGDLAILRMRYVDSLKSRVGGEGPRNGGYALMIFRRGADDSWIISREMWTHVRERFLDELMREHND